MTGATTNIIPARIGQEDVLVEAVVVPGTEKLSSKGRAVDRVQTMLDGAQSVIRSFAEETAGTVARIRQTVGSPDEGSVALGLSFATTGKIIWPFWRLTSNSIHITCCKDKPLINRKISTLILKIGQ